MRDAVALTRSLLQFRHRQSPRPRTGLRALRRGDAAGVGLQGRLPRVRRQPHQRGGAPRRLATRRRRSASPATSTSCRSARAPGAKDPFRGETDGDKLYGRGSSDMKAGRGGDPAGSQEPFEKAAAARRASWSCSPPPKRAAASARATSRRRSSSARPARWWWASRPRTTRWSATRARSSSTPRSRASARTARCPSSASTRSTRRRRRSASWKRFPSASKSMP